METMRPGRIMALDYGTKNVGLACSDELRILVRPLPSLPVEDFQIFLKKLKVTLADNDIVELLVGVPLNMDGSRGRPVELVDQFVAKLKTSLSIPLKKVDERLSTVEALEMWQAMSRRRKLRYRTVDSLAAAIILGRYLQEGGHCED
jgi:putative Holliday junction resolvase